VVILNEYGALNHTDMGSSATFSSTNVNLTCLGLNLGLQMMTLETNSFSHATAFENGLIYAQPTHSLANITDGKLSTLK
jgi:hypothetical protein